MTKITPFAAALAALALGAAASAPAEAHGYGYGGYGHGYRSYSYNTYVPTCTIVYRTFSDGYYTFTKPVRVCN